MANSPSILVAIPVYNEEEYVSQVINEIKNFANNILIIDDGSTDNTPTLLSTIEGIETITHAKNHGYGSSLTDAIEFASKENYDWIITMDCDLQHEPKSIPDFLKLIIENKYDILSGSRFLESSAQIGFAPPPSRMKINKEITKFIKDVLGLSITDSFCGFKAYRVDFVKSLKTSESGYAFPLQLWVQAVKNNVRLKEVAVPMIYSDPKRSFGLNLDNPDTRMNYYIKVLNRELVANGFSKVEYSESAKEERYNLYTA